MTEVYPDEEIVALVATASQLTSTPVPVILEDFGAFLVPTLLKVYKGYIKAGWRTLDLLEHTESNIHKAVRLRDPGAEPPRLKVKRTSPTEVVIAYSSARNMCEVVGARHASPYCCLLLTGKERRCPWVRERAFQL